VRPSSKRAEPTINMPLLKILRSKSDKKDFAPFTFLESTKRACYFSRRAIFISGSALASRMPLIIEF
jgi:hypothetical protein